MKKTIPRKSADPLITLDKQSEYVSLGRKKEENKFLKTGKACLNPRAIILDFTRHALPVDLLDTLSAKYQYMVTYHPHEPFTFDYNSNVTQLQQIQNWVYAYLTTKRKNIGYPLDKAGDVYVLLPDRSSKLAVYIMLALIGIWNRDYTIVWSIGNKDDDTDFVVDTFLATSAVKKKWKSLNHEVTEISLRKEQEVMLNYDHFLSNIYEISGEEPTEEDIKNFKENLNEEQEEYLAIGIARREFHANKQKSVNANNDSTNNSTTVGQSDTN